MVYEAVMPVTEPSPDQDRPKPEAADAARTDAAPADVAPNAPKEAELTPDLRLEEDFLDHRENLLRGTAKSRLHDVLLVAFYVMATAVLILGIVWAVRGRLW